MQPVGGGLRDGGVAAPVLVLGPLTAEEAVSAHALGAEVTVGSPAMLAELAGATAHELNQPLTAVMGYADLLTRQVEAGSPLATASRMPWWQ